jgi:hypothetical protein
MLARLGIERSRRPDLSSRGCSSRSRLRAKPLDALVHTNKCTSGMVPQRRKPIFNLARIDDFRIGFGGCLMWRPASALVSALLVLLCLASLTVCGGGGGSGAAAPVIPAPVLTHFNPASALPGAGVTLAGAHFTGASAVTFGGVAANSFTVDGDISRLRRRVEQ